MVSPLLDIVISQISHGRIYFCVNGVIACPFHCACEIVNIQVTTRMIFFMEFLYEFIRVENQDYGRSYGFGQSVQN